MKKLMTIMALSTYLSTHVSSNWFSISFLANLTIANGLLTFRWSFTCFVKVVLYSVLNSGFNLLNISLVRSFKVDGSMSPFCFVFILLFGFVLENCEGVLPFTTFKHAWQSNILCGVQIMPICGHSNYANFQQKTLPTNVSFSAETSSQELHISNNLFEIIDKGTILDNAMSFSRKCFQKWIILFLQNDALIMFRISWNVGSIIFGLRE